MINIEQNSLISTAPYKLFYELYEEAINESQKYIEAANISTYNKYEKTISSRFVNIKISYQRELDLFY